MLSRDVLLRTALGRCLLILGLSASAAQASRLVRTGLPSTAAAAVVRPPLPAGGTGSTKRLLSKARRALVSPATTSILVDGTNVRGLHSFRTSERELLEQISAWATSCSAVEPAFSASVLVCFDGAAASMAGGDGVEDGSTPEAYALADADASAPRALVSCARSSSPAGPSADELIVRAVALLRAAPEGTVVVSADKRLLARCPGVRSIHPIAFASVLRAASSGAPGAPAATAAGAARRRGPARASAQMRGRGAEEAEGAGGGWELQRGLRALRTPGLLGGLALAGACLGPWLDGQHGAFGVLAYSPPLALRLPVGPLAAGALSQGVLRTALWVPPLFALAGALIGGLHVGLDAARPQGPERSEPPAPPEVLAAVGCFCAQYWLSGALWAADAPGWLLYAALAASGWGVWRVFDRTQVGLLVCAMTAVGGPLVEVALLNGPALLGAPALYSYAQPDLPQLGINGWIAPVYFAGAPAVGSLARWAQSELQARSQSGAGAE